MSTTMPIKTSARVEASFFLKILAIFQGHIVTQKGKLSRFACGSHRDSPSVFRSPFIVNPSTVPSLCNRHSLVNMMLKAPGFLL